MRIIFEDQVFKRILLSSETGQLEGLKGCVAVMNCKQQDSNLTLQQAADKEVATFLQLLQEAPAEYKTEAMQQKLGSGMTSKQLIFKLDEMYHDHIIHKWRDGVILKIVQAKRHSKQSLHDLGPAPDTSQSTHVLSALYDKVCFEFSFVQAM